MLVLGLVANVCLLLASWELRERIEIDGRHEVEMLIHLQDVEEVSEEWMRKGFGSYKRVEEELGIGEGVRLGPPGRSPF